ncbi:MAG: iron donor protein CyaY [Planctomycetes bacterium]|nr:iron donor protein CyaY [Planctomycetota bacterium]
MEKSNYTQRVDACLARVATWLEAFDPDELDYGTTDGVVSLQFPDGARFVLNRQSAASQVWFAAGARAWHYNWDDAQSTWVDDRDGHALFANIARVVSQKLQRTVSTP